VVGGAQSRDGTRGAVKQYTAVCFQHVFVFFQRLPKNKLENNKKQQKKTTKQTTNGQSSVVVVHGHTTYNSTLTTEARISSNFFIVLGGTARFK
tara:strand:- start:334 stop:615 length:282 start_codon:yes stop_codon:yes gene_type:complete